MSSAVSGRPVRFFVVLMGGWIAIRLASAAGGMFTALSPAAPPVAAPVQPVLPAAIMPPKPMATGSSYYPAVSRLPPLGITASTEKSFLAAVKYAHAIAPGTAVRATPKAPHVGEMAEEESAIPVQPDPAIFPAIPLAQASGSLSDRLRGSVWLLWREGSASPENVIPAGRLGGSQAGLRIDYDLTPAAPGQAAVYGRASAALNRPASPEAALGIAWQPARPIPVSIAAERRIALGKGGRDANALLVVGGFGPMPIIQTVEAEAYAQAGMVGFRRGDLFVDGKLSVLAPVGRSPARVGISISGGAQPRVERLDLGPEIQFRLPLPRIAARLGIEWRERVSGTALPSSGLAVTLGGDF